MAIQHRSDPRSASPPDRGGFLSRLAGIPAGRRTKWIVLVVWLVVLAAVSPFAGKLSEVEENETSAWLPESAESLKVHNLLAEFPEGETFPAVIVYYREEGLTDADRARIEADRQTLVDLYPEAPASPAIPSEDGKAVIITVPFPSQNNEQLERANDAVEEIRDTLVEGDGLQIKVTGPAGFTHDLANVFSGIDSTLLLATASVVTVLLLLTYRSPFLWLIPLLTVAFAHQSATAAVYGLAKHAGITVNGQSGGILPVLVFGAGTDYALLLIARYREELRRHEDKHVAMARALRQAGPAILASAGTVVIGLLCLLAADLNSNQSLGPVGATGIVAALIAMITLLPAFLVIFGRRIFWPFVPRYGSESHEESGLWAKVGRWVGGRPRPVWIGTVAVLAVLALGLIGINTNLAQADQFRDEPDAITGSKLIARSFPAGASQPATVIANREAAEAVQAAIAETAGVARVEPAGETETLVSFSVTLDAEPASDAAFETIDRLRDRVHAVPGADALVGGPDAESLDVARANSRDREIVMPLVLAVVLVILAVLLRAIVAPVLLIATVVLSYGAALGASTLVFDHIFGFAAVEGSVPLLGFVFLVALGIDYNIFLMSRVHEESARLGTRSGMLKGLAVTGGVITSAGLVLAATFAVLGVLPLVSMTEMGFLVAFGVLLDTFIVRSILVPALTFDLGRRIWWPSRLSRRTAPVTQPAMTGQRVPAEQ
ncbi:MAG TPA: MMPL family transporter [Thermomicrobiales bacterium]